MTTANGQARPKLTPEQRGPTPLPTDPAGVPRTPPRAPVELERIQVRTREGWRGALYVCEYRRDAIVVQLDGETIISSVWGGYGDHLGAWRYPNPDEA